LSLKIDHDWYWEICPVTQVTGLFLQKETKGKKKEKENM